MCLSIDTDIIDFHVQKIYVIGINSCVYNKKKIFDQKNQAKIYFISNYTNISCESPFVIHFIIWMFLMSIKNFINHWKCGFSTAFMNRSKKITAWINNWSKLNLYAIMKTSWLRMSFWKICWSSAFLLKITTKIDLHIWWLYECRCHQIFLIF